ncbi:MAG: hypothetical protein KTR31_37255 [Myxococcales bacterium]|nr:hypothetical protein [Myxococcales bacterium]
MNQRSVIWAGLFGGVGLVLLVWLMSSDTTTEQARGRAPNASAEADGLGFERNTPATLREARLRERKEPKRRGTIIRGRRDRPVAEAPPGMRTQKPVTPGEPLPLDQEGVKAAVDTYRPDLDGCYRTARLHSPDLPADHALSLNVVPMGGKEMSRIASITTDTDDARVLESCMTAALSDVRFEGSQTTTIRFPVTLAAE